MNFCCIAFLCVVVVVLFLCSKCLFYVVQAGLELTLYPKLISNSLFQFPYYWGYRVDVALNNCENFLEDPLIF